MPVNPAGITLLGTEATAQFTTSLQPAPAAAQAAKRLEQAQKLAARLKEVMRLTPPAAAKQAVWTINRCVVAQALSFDFRVLPCALAAPYAEALEKSVVSVAEEVIGVRYAELSHQQRSQVHLPVRCAGLQLTRPTTIAPLARAAALMEGGPLLRREIASWPDCTEQQACTYDGIDAEVDSGIVTRISQQGVHAIAGDGTPAHATGSTDLALHPAQRAGLGHSTQAAATLRPPVPARHLLSAMLRHVADSTYDALLEGAPPAELPRLRSAAGPTAGTSLVAPLSFHGMHFTDEEWVGTLRRRLGLLPVGTQRPHGERLCQNWNCSKQQYCGEVLDSQGCHAAVCPCGPLTNLCHNGLADRWCDVLEETGVCTRRELYVPTLSTVAQEAWLDVGTFGPGDLGQQLFDITVRHPGAARYADAAAVTTGATAEHGDRDKADRYGSSVFALVHESWGRLGEVAESLLMTAAEVAARLDWRRGRVPGQRLQRWRAQLDADLQRAQASMQLSAINGLPGRTHRRPAAADLPLLQTHGAWPAR